MLVMERTQAMMMERRIGHIDGVDIDDIDGEETGHVDGEDRPY